MELMIACGEGVYEVEGERVRLGGVCRVGEGGSPQRRSDAEISAEKQEKIKARVKGRENAEEAEL
jgi:hypothetical protein